MGYKMLAPAGNQVTLITGKSGTVYQVASDGSVSNVASGDVDGLMNIGFTFFGTSVRQVFVCSPLPADLVSIKAAATPANGTITIAAQPVHARKLQVRVVDGGTHITAGTLTLVGFDQDGNAITEVISLIGTADRTVTTANAFASLTSGTVAGLAGGGSSTLGIGVSNDFGIPTRQGVVDFALLKVTKTTKVLGTSNVSADDVASTATVDTVARTVNPTTAPAANGLVDYAFTVSFS